MASPQTATVQSIDKVFMENTLLRVTGALFCHDIKRASTRVEPITLNPGIDGKLIKIRPDPELGQPGPARPQSLCRAHQEALGLRTPGAT